MYLAILIRSIVGAIVGAVVGYVLARVMEWNDARRLKRIKERTDEAIAAALAPIKELDSRRW